MSKLLAHSITYDTEIFFLNCLKKKKKLMYVCIEMTSNLNNEDFNNLIMSLKRKLVIRKIMKLSKL